MQAHTQQHDTVDLLCHRHLGTTAGGVVEHTYTLNPGLAELGPLLPAGRPITLPDATRVSATTPTVNLWD